MNEQLQGKLVEILTGIQEATKAAGDFAMEQLPEIAQTYVAYGRVNSLVDVTLSIAIVAVGVFVLRGVLAHIKKAGELIDADPAVLVFGGSAAFICLLCGVPLAKKAIAVAVLVWLAPKVWLLKELAGLVK